MKQLHINRKQLFKQKGHIDVGEMSNVFLDESQTNQLSELLATILTGKGEINETTNQ